MPTYLAMGMSADEYWNGDPYLTVVYLKKQELINEQKNADAWWQGMYVYDAITAVAQSLTRKRGQSPAMYPKEPYRLKPQSEMERAENAESERQKAVDYFENLRTRLKKKYG